MKIYTSIFLLFVSVSFTANAQKSIHHSFDVQLQKYVSENGNVDYKAWKKDQSALKNYIGVLEQFAPNDAFTKNDSLAYFINAYNAVTINLILDNFPIASIKDIKSPWDKKLFNLNGKKISLNHIEHEILRKMKEPRIHFAVNCASVSCPKLLNTTYKSGSMGKQLQESAKAYVNNTTQNKLSPKKIQLSKIFLWFGSDFGNKKERLEFIQQFTPIKLNSPKISYLDYDWNLND